MGNNILKKLESSKGASLTFALLAFLVCAVISAVLLASASASAGRLSNLAESDQRYYAVTSAAQLFCDALDGQSFTIERTMQESTFSDQTYYTDANGERYKAGSATEPERIGEVNKQLTKLITPDSDTRGSIVAPIPSTNPNASLLTEAAFRYVFGNTAIDNGTTTGSDLAGIDFPSSPTFDGHTWNMVLSVGDEASLKVSVEAVMDVDGTIKCTFRNMSGDPFFIRATLIASTDYDEVEASTSREGFLPDNEGREGYFRVRTTTTITTTRTTTIKWTVAEVKKVSE